MHGEFPDQERKEKERANNKNFIRKREQQLCLFFSTEAVCRVNS
jgi:hypothetical protein